MSVALVWLRNDLRLADNPALAAAHARAETVIALYIHETDAGLRAPGGAARWWLHQSLSDLAPRLARQGIALRVEAGEAETVLETVIRETGAQAILWNRRYAPAARLLDARIKQNLRQSGLDVASFPGNLLAEPWTVTTGQGAPYSVFTPFWKNLRNAHIARPLPAPTGLPVDAAAVDGSYRAPAWSEKLRPYWRIGEEAAQETLSGFLDGMLAHYPDQRNYPARDATSRLSPHLRFGEISARQMWHAAQAIAQARPDLAASCDKFLSELAWRDFSYHQLYHRADISSRPMQEKYAVLHWREAPADLAAWQRGQTGIPIIDAGMRELWETGYMHNRVRMLTASLLTKNLLIDWRSGESWFWDCLVDADEASNPASWQWVAGCGLDAAPYFRIFNPATQGERWDEAGDYVRRWVPELAGLPDKWIHMPEGAPPDVLHRAGISLGVTYPKPIVDLKTSRSRALEAFKAL